MIELRLTADEILAAVVVAAMRKITSDRRRSEGRASRRAEHYDEKRAWDQEIESALAEIAVARWRNRYWMGAHVNGTPGSDAGRGQVRWTEHSNGSLILYEEDADDAAFVLVTGRSPMMRIVGWIEAREGKADRYWRESGVRCPSWWIPQSDLRQII